MELRKFWGAIPSVFFVTPALFIILVACNAWAEEPELTYHGQFRINSYSQSNGDDDTQASRLRWRPTIDVKVSDTVALHTQFNIGHIKQNLGNARFDNSGDDPVFALRHALIKAKLSDSVTGVAGLVPVSDYFGDTLFSADWDFSPLTLAFLGASGDLKWRVGIAKLVESEETNTSPEDDFDAYVFDVDKGPFGGSVYYLVNQTSRSATDTGDTSLLLYGLRYSADIGSAHINAFVIGSSFHFYELDHTATGYAAKFEAKIPIGEMTLGVMGIYASGDKDYGKTGGDSNSFITPMSVIGHHGYWGYTGKLTIQGPTDTGIDDPINIDGGSYGNQNLGRGIQTIQVNFSGPLANKLSYYVGAGWFASAEAPSGESDDIGTDVYGQIKWNIGQSLNLEAGVDFASVGEGSHLAKDGKSTDYTLFFSRLQLEY